MSFRFRSPFVLPLRTSPAAWSSPLIAVATGLIYWNHIGSFGSDPALSAYVARSLDGLNGGLPIAAAVAALCGHRQRRGRPVPLALVRRGSMRLFWSDTWPLFAAVGVALGILVVFQSARAVPVWTPGTGGLLLTAGAMVITAVGGGYWLGSFLHSALAVPVAIFGMYLWIVLPQTEQEDLATRNVNGFSLYGCCDLFSFEPDPRAIAGPVVVAVGVLTALVIRRRFPRAGSIFLSAACITASGVGASLVVAGSAVDGRASRPQDQIECRGAVPEVCLFPEQRAAGVEDRVREAWTRSAAMGIALPERIAVDIEDQHLDRATTTPLLVDSGASGSAFLRDYAASVVAGLQCRAVDPAATIDSGTAAAFSLAVVMGGDLDEVAPTVVMAEDIGDEGVALTTQEIVGALGFSTRSDITAYAARWVEDQHRCWEDRS